MSKDQGIQETKEELQTIMSHKMVILRDILSTLRQEQNALLSDDQPYIQAIAENRLVLIKSFNEWNTRFIPVMEKLSDLLGLPFEIKSGQTFLELLTQLGEFLNEEDFELLLSKEQLMDIVQEIQNQTNTILHYIDNKQLIMDGGTSFPLQANANFLKFTVKKEGQPKKAIVGLMDAEQKEPDS